MHAEALAALRAGRAEVSKWMVENARNVKRPTVIIGLGARVLYQALAGRWYGCKPSEYSSSDLCNVARYARAFILRRRGRDEAWRLAWRCVEAQGPEIQPWLCTLVVDADGVPVADSPLYGTRLPLSGEIWRQ
jgi:hypothetical protein